MPRSHARTRTAATAEFWFQIPVDTQEIELADIAGTRIALWSLAIPLLPGES